jgi:hypothetical protein
VDASGYVGAVNCIDGYSDSSGMQNHPGFPWRFMTGMPAGVTLADAGKPP